MRRLVVQCNCGERIQVPQSALGRTGLCPSCGTTIAINKDNATPLRPAAEPPRPLAPQERSWQGSHSAEGAPPDIRRRFAEGVDLYFAKRYSEALVIFNTLAAAMPHDADIQMGQSMCINALRKLSPLGLSHEGFGGHLPAPPYSEERSEALLNGPTPSLDSDFFKRFLFDKMLHGSSDEIQMRAAELAAKMFCTPGEGASQENSRENPDQAMDESDLDDVPNTTPFRRAASPDDLDR